MSIEKLEEIRTLFFNDIKLNSEASNKYYIIDIFMMFVIEALKHQSDKIADLRQELAKKEESERKGGKKNVSKI